MKPELTLAAIFTFLLHVTGYAQLHYNWSLSYGSKKSDLVAGALLDHEDNVYAVNTIRDTTDVDPGPGVDLAVPLVSDVIVLSKFNGEGEFLWSNKFHGGDDTWGSMAEIKYNKITMLFDFQDSLVHEINGEFEKIHQTTGRGFCIMTLTLDGDITNSYFFPNPGELYLMDYITLPDQRVVVAGSYRDTMPGVFGNNHTLQTAGEYDAFIIMMSPAGQIEWTREFKSTEQDYFQDIHIHENNRIYFSTVHFGELTLQTKSGPITFIPVENEDVVFGYMDMDGNIEFAHGIAGPKNQSVREIQVDADENMYVAGYFGSTVDFNAGNSVAVIQTANVEHDGFVAKYDPDGELSWLKVYRNQYTGGVYTLELKRGNELYLSGSFSYQADLDPGPDSLIAVTGPRATPFISKLDLDGNLIWAYPFLANDYAGIRKMNVATETSRLFINAYMYDTLSCPDLSSEFLTSNGGSDMYIISLSEENVISAAEAPHHLNVDIYPNPAADHVTLTSTESITGIMLFDLKGGMLKKWDAHELHEKHIKLNDLAPGVYFLRVESPSLHTSKKIVVQ